MRREAVVGASPLRPHYLGSAERMLEVGAQDNGKNMAGGCSHQFLVAK